MSQSVYLPRDDPAWQVPPTLTSTVTITYPIHYQRSLSEPESEPPMSNLDSLAALEAVPIGHVVRVDGNDWTRVEKGLSRDGAELALHYFEGAVLRSAVEDRQSQPPEANEWWEGRSRYYFISRVSDTTVYHQTFRSGGVSVMNRDGSSSISAWLDSPTLHRLTGPPSVVANSPGLAEAIESYGSLLRLYHDSQEAVRLATERLRTAERKVSNTAETRRRIAHAAAAIRNNLAVIENQFQE